MARYKYSPLKGRARGRRFAVKVPSYCVYPGRNESWGDLYQRLHDSGNVLVSEIHSRGQRRSRVFPRDNGLVYECVTKAFIRRRIQGNPGHSKEVKELRINRQ